MSFKQLLEKSSKEVRFEEIEIKTVEESWLYLSMNDSSAVKQFSHFITPTVSETVNSSHPKFIVT